jgi:hypothetical protein
MFKVLHYTFKGVAGFLSAAGHPLLSKRLRWGCSANWRGPAGSIDDGSGHIPKGGTAADGPIPSNWIFVAVTVTHGWSWRSATLDAVTSSINQLFFGARCPATRGRRRRCLRSPRPN